MSTTKLPPAVNVAGLTPKAVVLYALNARALTDEKLAADHRALALANAFEGGPKKMLLDIVRAEIARRGGVIV